jgi:hypothetical protein
VVSGTVKLYGRQAEEGALREALSDACLGRGRLMLVEGEAGIGKTALTQSVAAAAREQGARVLWGQAWELGEAPPYFPLRAGLRELGVRCEPVGDHAESEAFALWERALEALARAAREQPQVWVVEDAHAADLLSLDLLAFLAQPLMGLAALVVITARTHDARLSARARTRLQRLARAGARIELGPLAAADVRELAACHAGQQLSARASRALAARTGGNPLFVLECLRALRGTAGEQVEQVLPDSVREAILDRLATLAPLERDALGAGAVLGRQFGLATLSRVLGASPSTLAGLLEPALRERLLVAAGDDYAFSHVIVCEVVESSLAAERRGTLHFASERALAALGDGLELVVQRARHALESMLVAEPVHIANTVEYAARMLEQRGAWDRAHALLARLWEQRRAAGLPPRGGAAGALHLAELAYKAGRPAHGRALCLDLIAQARAAGDAVALGHAALELGRDLTPAVKDRDLATALSEASLGLAPGHQALGCLLQARLAAALQPAPDPLVPVGMAEAAIQGARALGDSALLVEVLLWAGAALVGYAPVQRRILAARELLERANALGDSEKALRARARLAMDYVEIGDFAAFDVEVAQLLEASDELGHPRQRFRPLLLASMRACLHGAFGESERYVVEAAAIAELIDDPALALSLPVHRDQRAFLRHADSDLRELLALDMHGHGSAEPSLIPGIRRAAVYARLEDQARTSQELARLEPRVARLECDAFMAWLAEAYALAGSELQRRRLRTFLGEIAEREVTSGHVPITYEGPVLRLLALLDAALGKAVLAEAEFRDALAKVRARSHTPWVAQVAYEFARFLTSRGREQEALPLAIEAQGIAAALDMPGLVQRARALVGAEACYPEPIPTGTGLECQREGDYWRLERDGRTIRVRHSRGLELIARLVERARDELHVLTLVSGAGPPPEPASGAIPLLDERARQEYRVRIRELDAELASAEQDADLGRFERLQRERAALNDELARAFGLAGVARPHGSATERARINVQRNIKSAITHLATLDPQLAQFLTAAIRTGTYCCFRP